MTLTSIHELKDWTTQEELASPSSGDYHAYTLLWTAWRPHRRQSHLLLILHVLSRRGSGEQVRRGSCRGCVLIPAAGAWHRAGNGRRVKESRHLLLLWRAGAEAAAKGWTRARLRPCLAWIRNLQWERKATSQNHYSEEIPVDEVKDLYQVQVVIWNIVFVLSKALFCCGWCRCSCSRVLNIQTFWFTCTVIRKARCTGDAGINDWLFSCIREFNGWTSTTP